MANGGVDLDKLARSSGSSKPLLERYAIPVDNLSYEHISACTDGKQLERIVLILRSGEEGVFPDLTKHAEERLARVRPNSALLRKAEAVITRSMLNVNERNEIDSDIDHWLSEMHCREKDLQEGKKSGGIAHEHKHFFLEPRVRASRLPATAGKQRVLASREGRAANSGTRGTRGVRVAACDYAAWDKYDADAECDRIDLRDERRQVQARELQDKLKRGDDAAPRLPNELVNKLPLTATEIDAMAAEAREKGNEAYRADDYQEALRYYDHSIAIDANPSAYNNRAMTLIKLGRYEDAINDCNTVLSTDYRNVKALLRRAFSLRSVGKCSQALTDYECVAKSDPNNRSALSALEKLRKPCQSQKIRMKIEETDSDRGQIEFRSNDDMSISLSDPRNERDLDNVCFCEKSPDSSSNPEPHPRVRMDCGFANRASSGTIKPVIKFPKQLVDRAPSVNRTVLVEELEG